MAVPVTYEAFHSVRRRAVTVLCLMLATIVTTGVSVYIDSRSIHMWDESVGSVGPVAMTVTSYEYGNLWTILDDIKAIEGVTRAALLERHEDVLLVAIDGGPKNGSTQYTMASTRASVLETNTTFPGMVQLFEGRLPSSSEEIAINEWTAEWIGAGVGSVVSFQVYLSEGKIEKNVTIVGLYQEEFSVETNIYSYATGYVGGAIVNMTMTAIPRQDVILLDVDRSRLSPEDSDGSAMYLQQIQERICHLDFYYHPPQETYSRYHVNNQILMAVYTYTSSLLLARITQIFRGAGVALLIVLVVFLALRYNYNERKYEMEILSARGASKSDLDHSMIREMIVLSSLAVVIGIGVGVLLSRVGTTAIGYFVFDPARLWTEPFLMTRESLILSVVTGAALPFVPYVGYQWYYSTVKKLESKTGKLVKLTRILSMIKWDALLVMLSVLALSLVYTADPEIRYNPLVSFTFFMLRSFTPFALFLGVGSLFIKGLKGGTDYVARALSPLFGRLASSVGIRRLGRTASSAAPTALVLVLAISMAWSSAVVATSLPATKLAQARFAFGGDISYRLSSVNSHLWMEFAENVSSHLQVQSVSFVSVATGLMSQSDYHTTYIVGLEPGYVDVGYDWDGRMLNESQLKQNLVVLQNTPHGAIVSADIAETYQLEVGSTLRVSSYYGSNTVYVFIVTGVVTALTDFQLDDTGTDPNWWWSSVGVGRRTLWVNRAYLSGLANLTSECMNFLAVRTKPGTNSTSIAEDIVTSSGSEALVTGISPTVRRLPYHTRAAQDEVDYYTNRAAFQMDRAADTVFAVGSVAVMLAAFMLYAAEDVRGRKREIALTRALGAHSREVGRVQAAEMTVIVLSALMLLGLLGPLFILNAVLGSHTSYYVFPTPALIVVPFDVILSILALFVATALIFVLGVSVLSSRIHLATSLNDAWTEAAPFGGRE
ncbi:MAG: ABC transporter permease [Candidatus Thorarchaeota archaeon]|nr:ABC transporter permease [Candidatus Thorarchaeota archaeon]